MLKTRPTRSTSGIDATKFPNGTARSSTSDAGIRQGPGAPARTIRLVLLARSLDYGGAERQLIALAKGLHARGHHVVVAVFYPGGALEAELRAAGVPVVSLDKSGRWDVIGFLYRFGRFLRQERPEILHGYLPMPNILALLAKPVCSGKVVWGVRASNMEARHYGWLAGVESRVERTVARFATLIICNSHAARSYHVSRGFPANRTIVIPNGIDTERFRPDPGARRRVRAAWGVDDREKLVGLVGRIDPMKGHPTFLKAAAQLARERLDVRFICVGGGPSSYVSELRHLAHDLGLPPRLIWAGPQEDMPGVYNALDLVVSASSFGEGFSNVVGEAMACGVPCIVTDVGDSPLIVQDTAMVVPSGRPAALATAMDQQLDRLSHGEFDRALIRTRIMTDFSLSRLHDTTEQWLMDLPSVSSAR